MKDQREGQEPTKDEKGQKCSLVHGRGKVSGDQPDRRFLYGGKEGCNSLHLRGIRPFCPPDDGSCELTKGVGNPFPMEGLG